MEISGMAKRLIDMVQNWVGHWTGGLLIAEVVATYIFSGVSGSKAADMATIGAVMKTPVRAHGYPAAEFAAVLCASAAMSETVPPSLAMLILGSVTSLSISALFVAGIVPAVVLAIALVVAVKLRSRRHGWSGAAPFSLSRAMGSVPGAVPALGVPVIVIGGIVGGVASPTESGSLAVVYGIFGAWSGLRAAGIKRVFVALRDATLTAGMVLLMVACANVLAQAVVVDGLGAAIGGTLTAAHDKILFLFLSMAALIVIGFLLEGFPAILIAAPIFLPAAIRVGIDPLQFGILLIMASGIGVMMPPVGIGFYIACTVSDAPINPAMRASMVYNIALLLGLLVVMLLPALTLWLPHALGLH
jgi:C4-dicarboxylate transporter, DctM subunit